MKLTVDPLDFDPEICIREFNSQNEEFKILKNDIVSCAFFYEIFAVTCFFVQKLLLNPFLFFLAAMLQCSSTSLL